MGMKWIDIMYSLAVKAPLDSGFRRNDGVMQRSPPGRGWQGYVNVTPVSVEEFVDRIRCLRGSIDILRHSERSEESSAMLYAVCSPSTLGCVDILPSFP